MIRTLIRQEDDGALEEITINIGDISILRRARKLGKETFHLTTHAGTPIQLEDIAEYGLIREALEEFHLDRDYPETDLSHDEYREPDYENDFLTPAGSLMNEYNDLGTEDILPYDSPGGLDDY